MASSARIDELIKKFDENPRRYFAPLANEYRKAGELEQAVFICEEYLPQQPGHMSGHIVYGQALFELNRHEEAKTVFETALSLDPENLIALRHLGDIARQAGEAETARMWYQRVLEADPRNEEIAQLMLALLSNEGAAAAPAVDHSAPTPLSTPAVAPVPAPAAPVEDTSFHIEKAADTALEAVPTPTVAPVAEAAAAKEDDLLDLDAFDLGGVPLSTLRKSQEVAAQPEPSTEPEVDEASTDVDGMLDLSESFEAGMPTAAPSAAPPELSAQEAPAIDEPQSPDDEPFEADPFAIAAAPQVEPEPEVERSPEISLDRPDDDAPVSGLETFESGVLAATPPDTTMAIETDSFFSAPPTPLATEAISLLENEEDSTEEEASAGRTEAFVTETMATLYLQQGHLESAVDIYRRLVEQRPDDAGLRERLGAVEDQLRSASVAASAPVGSVDDTIDEPFAPAAQTYGGPTIREFLSGIISGRAPTAVAVEEAAVVSETALAVDEEPFDLSSPSVEAEEPSLAPVVASRPTPSSSETVSGSLGALFSEADAAATDNAAAQALSEAFAPDSPETAPLQGVPAHRASKELSLNHVFKGSTTPRSTPEAEDFSFDQFFQPEDEAAAPAQSLDTPPTSSEGSEGTDDIAQFNAWLNGLKKT